MPSVTPSSGISRRRLLWNSTSPPTKSSIAPPRAVRSTKKPKRLCRHTKSRLNGGDQFSNLRGIKVRRGQVGGLVFISYFLCLKALFQQHKDCYNWLKLSP